MPLTKASLQIPSLTEGRLTLESGAPISTTDQTAKTTVYFTPFMGNRISVYNGTSWQVLTFSEVSVSVPTTTTTPFDIFAARSGSTIVLETVNWTNDTTRATGITLQDGAYVKSGDATRKYLGTGRTTSSSGQCEDSLTKRFLWNNYNRQMRKLKKNEATVSWTYNSDTIRPANNSTANRVEIVVGVADTFTSIHIGAFSSAAAEPTGRFVHIGVNSTTTNSFDFTYQINDTAIGALTSRGFYYPSIGHTFYHWLESADANGNTVTYFSDNACGLTGYIMG